ncbi:MAG: hypothetical protein EHM41_05505 [Chloroflexi bacterium]|nr:MAG: hypothetical protein EHM41_05505 [Chloroflexota bacterium]
MSNLEMKTIDEKVSLAARMPEPSQEFADGLWRQIELQPRRQEAKRSLFGQVFVRPAWQMAVLVLLAAMVFTLVAVGPQHVLAQVQRWLGYMPGIGFVDLTETRYLVAPVSVERDGVTLQINQAVAEPDSTSLIISSPGLPDDGIGSKPPDFDNLPVAALHLPDGTSLSVIRQDLNYGGGKLVFPPIPKGVYQITFVIDRLPLLASGAAPEDWEIPLLLSPASGELPEELFPRPYAPTDASATANGVTARILQVAQTPEETALQVQFEWENPDWELNFGVFPSELRDDLGNIYYPIASSNQVASMVVQEAPMETSPALTSEASTFSSIETYTFPALSLAARQAELRLSSLEFSISDNAAFTFDPGASPQMGQAWELDEQMEISGVPLHLIGARLDIDDQIFPDEQKPFYSLVFTFRTQVDQPRSITIFFLETDIDGYHGGGGGMTEPGVFKIEMLFEQLPQKPLNVTIERARIAQEGPWEMHWQIPWTGDAVQPVREVNPEGVEETHGGLTLQVESASFNDVASVVNLAFPDLPTGGRILNVLTFDPSQVSPSRESQLYLEGSDGERIEMAQSVALQTQGEEDPGRLIFDPIPVDLGSVTLHVPAVERFLPGQAAFEIEVPRDITFHSEEFSVSMINPSGEQQEITQTRWVSPPWELDIPIEVAGYSMHFTQAQVERDLDASPPFRLVLTSEPLNRELNRIWLGALHISSIIRPDGSKGSNDIVNEYMRVYGLYYDRLLTENYNSIYWKVKLIIDVASPDGLEVIPGSYKVDIDGATVWISGPWELSWPVSGR